MVLLANFAAALGLLLPVVFFVGLRSSRDRELWEIGLDIPFAVSLDLIFVLCLTLVMTLERATQVSRAVYVVAAVAVLVARRVRRRPLTSWPKALGARLMLGLAAATLVGLVLSMWMGRTYVIWDRMWHIPLTTALRGQRLPFKNVFNGAEVLHYHFSGDVQAAMLETLSSGVLHASLALTLAHDVWFALSGLTLGYFMAWWGYRRVPVFALGTAAMLLVGPFHIFREGVRTPQEGYSLNSWLSFSYRPHLSLSGLLMLGFFGAVVARVGSRDDLGWRKTAPALCAITAAMAITDETSLGILGLALGLVWLFAPRVIHQSRKVGVLVFLALAAALVLPNLVFSAGLAPGGEHHVMKLVPWRSPGYYRPPLPLTKAQGWLMLDLDLFGPFLIGAGCLLLLLTRRSRGRSLLLAYFMTLFAISVFAFTRVDVDKSPTECHRFVFALLVLGPVAALAVFSPRFPPVSPVPARAPYAATLMAVGIAASSAATIDWGFNFAPNWCSKHHDFGTYNFYQTDCRVVVGDSQGARTRPTYFSKSLFFLSAGCIPAFTPGKIEGSAWKALTIGVPLYGKEALVALRKALPSGSSIPLVCPVVPDKSDPVCALAERSHACKPMGKVTRSCSLTAAQATALAK